MPRGTCYRKNKSARASYDIKRSANDLSSLPVTRKVDQSFFRQAAAFVKWDVYPEASIPLSLWSIPPCLRKTCRKKSIKNFSNTFSRQNFHLYPPKFLMTFFKFPAVNFLLHPPVSPFLPFLFNFPPILQFPLYFGCSEHSFFFTL